MLQLETLVEMLFAICALTLTGICSSEREHDGTKQAMVFCVVVGLFGIMCLFNKQVH